jgi:hypothetical protein
MIAAVLAAALAIFPTVGGANLNGKSVTLPADLRAPASFVYIAYVRGQQAQIDTWKPHVADILHQHPALGEVEVPTLPKSAGLFRGFIDGGMRRGIPDPAARAATITLYIDKRPFNQALGITSEDEIVVLLVRPDGTVLWRADGPFDPAKTAGLDAAIASLGVAG